MFSNVATIDQPTRRDYLLAAAIASLIIHGIAVILIWVSLQRSSKNSDQQLFFAEVVPPLVLQAPQQQSPKSVPQIVSPPQRTMDQQANPKRVFESDQDNITVKEQIRRGDDGNSLQKDQTENNSAKSASKQVSASRPQQPQPAKIAESKAESQEKKPLLQTQKLNLKLNNQTLADLSDSTEQIAKETRNEELNRLIQSGGQQNERSSVNVSRLGSRDYMPDIPDGEVTLLNTKANKFAVFVRRVASQVFANLRGAGWQTLRMGDIQAIETDGIFEAVLSPKGNLISVTQKAESGSSRFDQILQSAIKRGAKDPNPPQGAEADDGNIHFEFHAKSWVQVVPSNRSGAPIEKRWLVLGTGLE